MEPALVMNRVRQRKYPSAESWPFREKYPNVVDFINQLLDPVPMNRPTAAEAVKRTDILTVVSMDANKRMLRYASGRISALHGRSSGRQGSKTSSTRALSSEENVALLIETTVRLQSNAF